ncbi:MAG: hypothetical protein ACRD0G_04055 [Acidimicrobiales bacterium]
MSHLSDVVIASLVRPAPQSALHAVAALAYRLATSTHDSPEDHR